MEPVDRSGDSDARTLLGRAEALETARHEAEVFGDDYVRCEYLLLGTLGVLGDRDRLASARSSTS